MPIISNVNARSRQGKILYASIFVVLILGAITMVYPFLLMLSGSVRSNVDSQELKIIPSFWSNDEMLFRKYISSKYFQLPTLYKAWGQRPASWRRVEIPDVPEPAYLEDYLVWRAEAKQWELGHCDAVQNLSLNARLFRRWLSDRYDEDLSRVTKAMEIPSHDWSQIKPPNPDPSRFRRKEMPYTQAWYEFGETRPLADRYIVDPDAMYVGDYLTANYSPDIANYNKTHGTDHDTYDDVVLSRRVPIDRGLVREDWEYYVRHELKLEYIRLDPSLANRYRGFLKTSLYDSIDDYNEAHHTSYSSFTDILMPEESPATLLAQSDYGKFIKSVDLCPAENIEIRGPRQDFEKFVAKRRNRPLSEFTPIRLPTTAADYHDLMDARTEWRKRFTTQNYITVLEYIHLRGNGIRNTIIYCLLAIGSALLINPLAAYALSRYKPPSMYKILLFCMATMAFPGEVTMIPAFLLLKRFPLWQVMGGLAVLIITFWLLKKYAKTMREGVSMTIAVALAVLAGAWLIPAVLQKPHVSMLNTFWALVLPGAAQGFFIFLLKGFFDSLPRELYESAEIDGAGEWTKFWSITMSLSKPILAVIALNAFVSAYSAFMMALIIIPDKDMWTLMVWIFQLQSLSNQSIVYASLVITAIPTFLVFAFCQNIIIRGIVVPVEK